MNQLNQIYTLKEKLKLFGLNPKQWNLVPTSSLNEWYIINNKNKSHCLKGFSAYSSQGYYWADIELNSF